MEAWRATEAEPRVMGREAAGLARAVGCGLWLSAEWQRHEEALAARRQEPDDR